jgi:hypothetical protein
MWLRTGTSGELLYSRWWNFGFHKMRKTYWLAMELRVSRRTLPLTTLPVV